MQEDKIEIEILEDGTIKVSTDSISPANHLSADQFLKEIERLAGGKVTKQKNRHAGQHSHRHGNVEHSH
jgi:hypothetical protein